MQTQVDVSHVHAGFVRSKDHSKQSRKMQRAEMMKKIMNEGGLIPYQLTVQVLVNALIANPSKVSSVI